MTAVAVSAPPAPGPSRMTSRIDSPRSITALNAPSTVASGWSRLTRQGCTRATTAEPDWIGRGDQLGRVAELGAVLDVGQVEPVDADVVDLLQEDAGVKRDRREDGDLGRGVGARHVLGRVGLGVPEPLRFGQRVGVGRARLHHPAQDEVRGSVDDAVDPVDAAHDHRLAQHLDHRDGSAHARLEAQLHPVVLGGAEELLAVPCEELLVGRDDRLARLEEREDVLAGGLDPAHDLGDDRDRRVVPESREVGGEEPGGGAGVPGRIAHERRGAPRRGRP